MIRIIHGVDIQANHYELISTILNFEWNQGTTKAIVEQRMKSWSPWFCAIDEATPADAHHIQENFHLSCKAGQEIPIVVFEGVFLPYDDYTQIPMTSYIDITQENLLWRSPPKNKLAVLAMDITSLDSRQGVPLDAENLEYHRENLEGWISLMKPKKITATDLMIEDVLYWTKLLGLSHMFTYSPYHERFPYAQDLHFKHGAMQTNHLIQNARPEYVAKLRIKSANPTLQQVQGYELLPVPDAKITDYSNRIALITL
ncbi:MAG: hypothetical protein ABIJ34_03020 [archaeon]